MTPDPAVLAKQEVDRKCGNCGHSPDEHNDHGYCMHYEHGTCICFEYVPPDRATPEMRARRLFGRQWHSVYSFKEPFTPGGPCQRADCPRHKKRRIMVNIWGSVCEFDVCDECGAEFHGKLLDEFPAKAPPGGTAVLAKDGVLGGGDLSCLPSLGPPEIGASLLAKDASAEPAITEAHKLDKHAQRVAQGKRRAQTLTTQERQKGGRRGGAARANKLAPDVRESIARKAGLARWGRV